MLSTSLTTVFIEAASPATLLLKPPDVEPEAAIHLIEPSVSPIAAGANKPKASAFNNMLCLSGSLRLLKYATASVSSATVPGPTIVFIIFALTVVPVYCQEKNFVKYYLEFVQ